MAKNDDTCSHPVALAINSKLEGLQEDGRRRHLGGSFIGRDCKRELWYVFRWATDVKFKGRMLRLFNRGHKEEFRFVEWLRMIGVEVQEYDNEGQRLYYHNVSGEYIWVSLDRVSELHGSNEYVDVTNDPIEREIARRLGYEVPQDKQWRILDIDGHFGGSLDGVVRYVPGVQVLGLAPDTVGLVEFKTHGLTSFEKLVGEGVKKAKPEHYAQMQIYMHKKMLPFAIYMAICKNDDRLHVEFVQPEFGMGEKLLDKAREVIYSRTPPAKISNNPTWFKCKFCDHRQACHFGAPLAKSCRTCVNANPVSDGRWFCARWQTLIPQEAEKEGCGFWVQIEG